MNALRAAIGTAEPTRYEVTARHPDGRALTVCYVSGSPSGAALRRALHARGARIVAALGLEDGGAYTMVRRPRPAAFFGPWRVGFTGRTQREAFAAGDVPPVIP